MVHRFQANVEGFGLSIMRLQSNIYGWKFVWYIRCLRWCAKHLGGEQVWGGNIEAGTQRWTSGSFQRQVCSCDLYVWWHAATSSVRPLPVSHIRCNKTRHSGQNVLLMMLLWNCIKHVRFEHESSEIAVLGAFHKILTCFTQKLFVEWLGGKYIHNW